MTQQQNSKLRWYQFSLKRLLLATAVFAAALGVAKLDPRVLGIENHAQWDLCVFVIRPIMVGALCGWATGIIFRRQLAGYATGLTLAVTYFLLRALNM